MADALSVYAAIQGEILELTSVGTKAEGHVAAMAVFGPSGFIVKTGSQARLRWVGEAHRYDKDARPLEIRQRLQHEGSLVAEEEVFRFTKDCVFSSPTLAAAVVLGRPASGPSEWRFAGKNETLLDWRKEMDRDRWMRLRIDLTSPYARLVRLALAEKGLENRCETEIVKSGTDSASRPAFGIAEGRPVLTTEDGCCIADPLLILRYLDEVAGPPVFPAQRLGHTLTNASLALDVTDAATAIALGHNSIRMVDNEGMYVKRHRIMADGLARLDAGPPRDFEDGPDIASFAAVTAIDYINFQFTDRDWLADLPNLAVWRERQKGRPSVDSTVPRCET